MTVATIAALASGRPPSAIAVIRVSGPQALTAVRSLTGRKPPPPRMMALRPLNDPRDGSLLDSALVVVFPGPNSASGEDLAELHLHGGPAVVSGVLAALIALPGVRLAEAGEFTRRAFANGRMDLAQVEGLADLVAAETNSQRDQALALAGGALSRLADGWRSRCIAILAEAEAALDFAEEEADVAARLEDMAAAQLRALAVELTALLADAERGARIHDGLTIAVTGAPNVGKSSLINALSGRDAAIVTPVAGTTRDAIEVPMNLDSVAAMLIDTAGLRDTDDPVEQEGIRRARARVAAADLVLQVMVAGDAEPPRDARNWLIMNKCDLTDAAVADALAVSALTGAGIADLRRRLSDWAQAVVRPGEPALLSRARHRAAFADAAAAIEDAAQTHDAVLRAENLRAAAQAFGRIAGRVDVDDVLDHIFSRFCIGK
ncbi:MAG: tRNA uridine-5-carboxymethylaminomethyl(34) synthesis GTPase MnmE [Pseudomonadota bacterium]|jgi:tRNA modification GTPase